MITGFNTDVRHGGHLYHVQTEDRGRNNPVLESLVYVGGTVIAQKLTPYSEQLHQGATEDMIASLLKRQHQVIIAAIKAGRIEDLIRHSTKPKGAGNEEAAADSQIPPVAAKKPLPAAPASAKSEPRANTKSFPLAAPPEPARPVYSNPLKPATPLQQSKPATASPPTVRHAKSGGLNLDEVISDYLRRSSEQGKLDLKVLAPNVFAAGKNIALRVQVSYCARPEADAIVTVKVIGTAFKPQVFMGRSGRDGTASFNIALPAFSAGTAAIVIEAQSSSGRGELKHLIRRS